MLVNAHYDSALGTVAASDDAVMIAVMLEVARVLVHSAPLPHAVRRRRSRRAHVRAREYARQLSD